MNAEALIGMLAELERIRELTLNLIERETPRLLPAPPDEDCGTERTVFDLLLGARRAVLGGLALMSVASVGFALAGSFETLFAARLVQGFGSSLTWAGALAWLTLSTPRERRGTLMGSAMGAATSRGASYSMPCA